MAQQIASNYYKNIFVKIFLKQKTILTSLAKLNESQPIIRLKNCTGKSERPKISVSKLNSGKQCVTFIKIITIKQKKTQLVKNNCRCVSL